MYEIVRRMIPSARLKPESLREAEEDGPVIVYVSSRFRFVHMQKDCLREGKINSFADAYDCFEQISRRSAYSIPVKVMVGSSKGHAFS